MDLLSALSCCCWQVVFIFFIDISKPPRTYVSLSLFFFFVLDGRTAEDGKRVGRKMVFDKDRQGSPAALQQQK